MAGRRSPRSAPFLRWLRGSLTFSVRQLHRYYGPVRILQNVHARIMDLSPSRTGLLAQTLWRPPGSRTHCLLTCLDSSTTPGPAATRHRTRLADVAFPLTEKGRHPVACFRSSIILPASPLSTLRYDPSRDHRQDSRPEWSRFSFSVGLLHPLQCAGLSRRSLSRIRSPVVTLFPVVNLGSYRREEQARASVRTGFLSRCFVLSVQIFLRRCRQNQSTRKSVFRLVSRFGPILLGSTRNTRSLQRSRSSVSMQIIDRELLLSIKPVS